jgi:cyanophycinase
MTDHSQPDPPRLALIGGEEFADGFEDVHAELLAELGGRPRVVFLPTCAADDGREAIDYWCDRAREQLATLDVNLETPRIVDAASANDDRYARLIAEADWIYFGGGYPHVAMRLLPNTRAMDALDTARARGALISGSSGGAMLLCAQSIVITPELAADIGQYWETGAPDDWDPPPPPSLNCLGWVPHSQCEPHFNRRLLPRRWVRGEFLPDRLTMIGIDEQTALVSSDLRHWLVRGRGAVTLIRRGRPNQVYRSGEQVTWA